MNCTTCQEYLLDNLARTADASLPSEIESHVAGCQSCQTERAALDQLHQRLTADAGNMTRPSQVEEIMERVGRHRGATIAGNKPQRRYRRLAIAAVATAATVAIICVIIGSRNGNIGSSTNGSLVSQGKSDKQSDITLLDFNNNTTEQTVSRRQETAVATATASPPPAKAPPAAPQKPPVASDGVQMGELSLADQICRGSLIVRAKILGYEDDVVEWSVSYVIYGRCDEQTIKLFEPPASHEWRRRYSREALLKEIQREPTEEEVTARILQDLKIVKGQGAILVLEPLHGQKTPAKDVNFRSRSTFYDVTPNSPLEKRIVQSIAKGDYLEPNPRVGDILEERIRQSPLIVRARLSGSTDDGEGVWSVVKVIRGQADAKTIVVNNDLFRLRAEAIVHHALRTKPSEAPPSDKDVEGLIAAEMNRLMATEQVPGREAILFLDECSLGADGLRGRLRHRLYEDPSKPQLDELERAIVDPSSRSWNL
jgi:hypothetical protein